MCNYFIGTEFHHNPIDKKNIRSSGKDQYTETKKLYKKEFGYDPPLDIWTTWKDTHYCYIDLKKHWVIPAGDWKALVKLLIKQIKI